MRHGTDDDVTRPIGSFCYVHKFSRPENKLVSWNDAFRLWFVMEHHSVRSKQKSEVFV